MMDFEDAAERLARDQKKYRGRTPVIVSAKAKREADYRKKQSEQRRVERQRQQQQRDYIQKLVTACDRSLGVKPLAAPSAAAGGLALAPTSIWGDGDKIALPPSVLERLTQSSNGADDTIMTTSPWMFRIGILNPSYQFPASVLLQTLKPPNDDDHDDTMHDDSEEEEEGDDNNKDSKAAAYLDELGHKYIAYTHGTVVEFTQEEGQVGLPAPMAAALLDPTRRLAEHFNFGIPVKRTKDPSGAAAASTSMDTTTTAGSEEDEVDAKMGTRNIAKKDIEEDMEKTPGHVAYGAFDVPDMPLEITMVRLPKGKGCTLTPTLDAIQNGFYNLQDVKLVLEQSLIRTRATLSVGDTVQTWHRGVKFELHVSKVIPSTYNAITCINTDIEVELGQVKEYQEKSNHSKLESSTGHTLSGGRVLSSSPTHAADAQPQSPTATAAATFAIELLPEPPQEQKDGVCTVQIRSAGVAPARRRFDIQAATLQDLFAFAQNVLGVQDPASFRLVTRFPRKVFAWNVESSNNGSSSTTMAEAGIQIGQEMFMVEHV